MYSTLSIRRNIRSRSYMDRVDYESRHDTIFYIYSLGRYHNRLHFHYGETNDLMAKELTLRSSLPCYTKLVCLPIEEAPNGKSHLDRISKQHNLHSKLPIDGVDIDCMVLPDDDSISLVTIMEKVYNKILLKD